MICYATLCYTMSLYVISCCTMLWCVLFSQSTHCCVMFVCAAPQRKDFHWTWRLRSPFFWFGFGVGLGPWIASSEYRVKAHSPSQSKGPLRWLDIAGFPACLQPAPWQATWKIEDFNLGWCKQILVTQVFNQPSWQRTGPLSLSFSLLQMKLSDAQDEFKLSCWQGFVWRHCYEVSAHTANYTEAY